MNRRFILSVAVAALLGFAYTQAPPVDPPKEDTKTDEQLQQEFTDRNAILEKTQVIDDEKRTQCNFIVDATYFNIISLAGPFVKDVEIDGVKKAVEFRFCIPAEVGDSSSLAYVLDADNTRVTRLTSGKLGFESVDTIRKIDEDGDTESITGLTYTSYATKEVCQVADPANNIAE